MKIHWERNLGFPGLLQVPVGAGLVVLGNQPHLVGGGGGHTFLIVWGILTIVTAAWSSN